MPNVTISVCMIVKDEERALGRCLDSVALFADEIIVVDTGSTDATKKIAARFTPHVHDFAWTDDFAAARNASYAYASCDYLMWLDADDVVPDEDARKICSLKSQMPPETDVVLMAYVGDERPDDPSSRWILLRDRLIRRSLQPRWMYPIHEAIPIEEGYRRLYRDDIQVLHKKEAVNEPGRNLRIFNEKLDEGFQMNRYNRAYFCRELCVSGQHERAVALYGRMRDEMPDQAHAGSDEARRCQADMHYAALFYAESMKALGRWEELLAELQRRSEEEPPDEWACCTMGDCLRALERPDDAVRWYERALQTPIDLRDLRVHYPACHDFYPAVHLATLYAKQGANERARTLFDQASKRYPRSLALAPLRVYLGIMDATHVSEKG